MDAFFIPFTAILFAELFDKSQLSVLLLASKTKRHAELLLGVFLAFVVVDGLAILLGSVVTQLLPPLVLRLVSGLLFIVFGVMSLRSKEEDETTNTKLTNPVTSGFVLVFFSEWGDKTQLASALFATRYNPIFVFFGVITALFLLSVMAIYIGGLLKKNMKQQTIKKIAGVLFLLIGIFFLFFQ